MAHGFGRHQYHDVLVGIFRGLGCGEDGREATLLPGYDLALLHHEPSQLGLVRDLIIDKPSIHQHQEGSVKFVLILSVCDPHLCGMEEMEAHGHGLFESVIDGGVVMSLAP